MFTSRLLSGLLILIVGIFLSYYFLSNTEVSSQKQVDIKKILFFIGSIFILVGLLSILMVCSSIDSGNYTPEKEDDITILNGVFIVICVFSLEKNIIHYLRKLKKQIQSINKKTL